MELISALKEIFSEESPENPKPEEKTSMKLLVLYHSMYGHIETMAQQVAEGARSVPWKSP